VMTISYAASLTILVFCHLLVAGTPLCAASVEERLDQLNRQPAFLIEILAHGTECIRSVVMTPRVPSTEMRRKRRGPRVFRW
jgi:hypothetical protein